MIGAQARYVLSQTHLFIVANSVENDKAMLSCHCHRVEKYRIGGEMYPIFNPSEKKYVQLAK